MNYARACRKGVRDISVRHIKAVILVADMLGVSVVDIYPILQYSGGVSAEFLVLDNARHREIKDRHTE